MQPYNIIPSFISQKDFLKAFPILYYGSDETWIGVMTPDGKICALTLKDFPGSNRILERYKRHQLIEKPLHLANPLPCLLVGTPFQHEVWRALLDIPRGEVVTYQDIAHQVGRPKAIRAVGSGVGANPISPLIPCHRVIGHRGGLGGYYWGLEAKRALLKEEGAKTYA